MNSNSKHTVLSFFPILHVSMWVRLCGAHMYVQECTLRTQYMEIWVVSGVFLNRSLPHSLRQVSQMNPELTDITSRMSQFAQGTSSLCLSNVRITRRAPHCPAFMWALWIQTLVPTLMQWALNHWAISPVPKHILLDWYLRTFPSSWNFWSAH